MLGTAQAVSEWLPVWLVRNVLIPSSSVAPVWILDFDEALGAADYSSSLEVDFLALEPGQLQHDHDVADFLAGRDMAHREGDARAGIGEVEQRQAPSGTARGRSRARLRPGAMRKPMRRERLSSASPTRCLFLASSGDMRLRITTQSIGLRLACAFFLRQSQTSSA